jgi:hypothetical protein
MPRKKKITIFISYARRDKNRAIDLLGRFHVQANASKRYDYKFWIDGDILVGADWHKSIQKAIKECDIGLLLVSPAFLGSKYIKNNELKMFYGKNAKPSIPILLQPVDFDDQDLKGLQKRQFFRLERATFIEPKAYTNCRGNDQKDEFAQKLFKKVEQRLNKLYKTKKIPPKLKKKASKPKRKAPRKKKVGP